MMPNAWGIKYEEVQSLCWLAYKGNGNPGTWKFPNTRTTWKLLNVFERGSFRAVLCTGSKTVLSFSGTDDTLDWVDNIGQGLTGVSGQYLYALRVAKSTSPDIIVGHSLGGGLASYCAVYGKRMAATINPAALNSNIFSEIAMFRNGSLVINYVASGEVLDILDIALPTMRRVGRTHRVSSSGFNPIVRHQISKLAGFQKPQKV